ncbi:site-specific integrase [Roseateles albus]|uniref:Site-specific integrase n=1 Tax=Roseateles albus TaxID=2987525 RepID=A0ABT5KGG7_9BURK|nr:site-specific integrase [Roseateles albus]MDC8773003.1 site-specific integrase [Roseateles albus]
MKNNKSPLMLMDPTNAPAELPILNPEMLGDMASAAESALLRQGESENTLRSYGSALRYWAAWFALRYRQPMTLPVPEAAVLQFIVDHAQRLGQDGQLTIELPAALDQALVAAGYKGKLGAPALTSLVHRVAVLSKAHQIAAADNPCQQPRVRELLAKCRRAYAKRGALPHKKPALTREPLQALLDTCDDSLCGLRDKALLLFAFSSGGRRRSEVVNASIENLRREGASYVYLLSHSKTNQSGIERIDSEKPVAGRAADALSVWIAAAKIKDGAVFRRVRRGNVIGERLSAAAVRQIVQNRGLLAGLPGDYSAHSLRSGFVTEAGRQQIPLGETMALTGHRSTASLVGYFRVDVEHSRAARLLDK